MSATDARPRPCTPDPRRPGEHVALRLAGLAIAAAVLPVALDAQEVARVPDVREEVDALFGEYDRTDSPGCALGIVHEGELVYARGYGMANLDLGVALGPGSVLRIGSTSKQFTAAAIALAAQNGELSLDDEIREYLPEMPESASGITIRMLLHHTSGVRDYLTLTSLAGLRDDDWYTEAEALELITRQQATNFEPGTEHLYSNSGYFLLSQIIERATGSSLREYAHERIFRPLGMRHTHFHDDHTEIVPDRASGYARDDDGFRISMTTLDMVGDGGVFTSVEDLVAWDRNFYEARVGGSELLETLLGRGVLANGDTLDYALGLSHGEYRGLPVIDHGGAFVGFRAQMTRFPEQRFTVICLCNLASTDPSTLSRSVADLFLAEHMAPAEHAVAEAGGDAPEAEPSETSDAEAAHAPDVTAGEPVELSAAALSRWAGLYRDVADGDFMRFAVRDGALTVLVGPGYSLVPLSETRFRLDVAPVEFRFEEAGDQRRLTLVQSGSPTRYEEVEPAVLTEPRARAYAGRYRSEELGVDYLIEARGTELVVRRGRSDPIPLQPTVEREFTLRGADVRFEPSEEGRARAFTIDAGRVRGIRFVRVEGSASP